MIRAKFKLNIPKMTRNMDHVVVMIQQKVALQLLTGIVNMTPVLTGRARGNWQVTIGQPTTTDLPETYDKVGQETIQKGSSTIQSLTTLGAIYLTNNLPYIQALEDGSSTQAPSGMVTVTLDRVSSQFR